MENNDTKALSLKALKEFYQSLGLSDPATLSPERQREIGEWQEKLLAHLYEKDRNRIEEMVGTKNGNGIIIIPEAPYSLN